MHSELPFRNAIQLALLILEWRTTGNPHFVDMAFLLCRNTATPVPHILLAEMIDVAEARLHDKLTGGTPEKARKTGARWQMLTCIGDMHFIGGLTIAKAASKTARMFADIAPEFTCKASTLERQFSELMASAPARQMQAQRTEFLPELSPEQLAAYQAEFAALPDAEGDLLGERR